MTPSSLSLSRTDVEDLLLSQLHNIRVQSIYLVNYTNFYKADGLVQVYTAILKIKVRTAVQVSQNGFWELVKINDEVLNFRCEEGAVGSHYDKLNIHYLDNL